MPSAAVYGCLAHPSRARRETISRHGEESHAKSANSCGAVADNRDVVGLLPSQFVLRRHERPFQLEATTTAIRRRPIQRPLLRPTARAMLSSASALLPPASSMLSIVGRPHLEITALSSNHGCHGRNVWPCAQHAGASPGGTRMVAFSFAAPTRGHARRLAPLTSGFAAMPNVCAVCRPIAPTRRCPPARSSKARARLRRAGTAKSCS